jgi:catechol 2,3-dioxygenase-like lactoylglutathione lyase family enzyme
VSSIVVGLAEIVLWTHDMARSLSFYHDLFGLEVISKPEVPARFLSTGEVSGGVPGMIVLSPHPDGADGAFPAAKRDRVLHHLAFKVAPDRYEELRERCAAAGLEVRGGIHPVLPGVRTFYVDDPEGNEVECISPELPPGAPGSG